MKKILLILVVIALGIFIFSLGVDSEKEKSPAVVVPTPSADAIMTTGDLYIDTVKGERTGSATLRLGYVEDGGYPILNVGLDVNGDGLYESYAVGEETQEEWIVQNRTAYVEDNTKNNYSFVVLDTEAFTVDEVNAIAMFSDEDMGVGWLSDETLPHQHVVLTIEEYELNEILGLDVPGNGPGVYRGGVSLGAFLSKIPKAHAQPNSIPDVHFDSELEIGDLSQGSMECAPTSVTNNLQALARSHGRAGDIPNPETMIEQLKTDFKFGDNGVDGVIDENYIAGKNAFMNRYNLPIVTTEINRPTFDDIHDALTNGGVVEMDLAFFEVTNGRSSHIASHVVTLTGISADGGEFELRGRDSATPEGNESWNFFPKDEGQPNPQIIYPKNRQGATVINKIYVQNWVTVDEAITAGVLPAGAVGSTFPVEMLVIDGNYYPKKQFNETNSPQDACGAPHYHKQDTAWGLRDKTSTALALKDDPASNKCGFGKVSDVPIEIVNLTWEQQQPLAAKLIQFP